MRKLTAVLFILTFFSSRASTPYHWECGTFTIDATDTLIYCPQISINYIYFTITNTGTTDIYVRQIINSSNLPQGWSVNMCNPNGCWGSNVLVDTFLVPASSFVTARYDFHADTTIGIGVISARFDDSAAPAVNGATFNLHALSLGTGVDEAQKHFNSVSIHPNPAMNELTVRSQEFGDQYEIAIFNALGEKHLTLNPSLIGEGLRVDVSSLAPGIYFVKLKTAERIFSAKFVKQ